jgi:hypothetical protein
MLNIKKMRHKPIKVCTFVWKVQRVEYEADAPEMREIRLCSPGSAGSPGSPGSSGVLFKIGTRLFFFGTIYP